MPAASDAIQPQELDALFACLDEVRSTEGVALAVSGGGDSTALMVLFADWLRQHGRVASAHVVLTVDHRLRPESVREAEAVAAFAARSGFRHATLVWEAPKPHSGVQAAARAARYRLMSEHARAHGLASLLTAHTLDDQAETLLMRLARGSGLDGLTAMAPAMRMGGLRLVRPFLDVPKSRLLATLRQRAIPWIEDPSNQSPVYERTRLRAARATLDGLGLTAQMLATSVRRLQRARVALDGLTESYCAEPPGGIVQTEPVGILAVDRERLSRAPEEIVIRLLDRCIAAAGGSQEPVPLSSLEAIVGSLRRSDGEVSWTLARAQISTTPDCIRFERELGRLPLPCLTLGAGATVLWDGRFVVGVDAGFVGRVEVRALGPEGIAELRRLGRDVRPARAFRLVPSFWRGPRLLAVPQARYWAEAGLEGPLSAAFGGLRYNSEGSLPPEQGGFDRFC
jgi:tRNA(Ile)-lysidine synthase